MKTLSILLSVCVGWLAVSVGRGSPQNGPLTLEQLRKLNVCELDRLFEAASPGEIPVGYAHGQVLLMTDAKLPKLRPAGEHRMEGQTLR